MNDVSKGNKKGFGILAAATLIIIIGLLFSGCEKASKYSEPIVEVIYPKAYAYEDYDAREDIIEQNPVEDNFIVTLNDFSYKTGPLIFKDAGKNTNFSPLSLYYALAIAASGAENETEAELLELLGVKDNQELTEQR